MIRFSASLVVVALGLLVAGGVTSKLLLVYVAIAVSAIALVFLIIGAILNRGELRASSPAEAPGDRLDEASTGRLDRAPADDREEAGPGRPDSVAVGVDTRSPEHTRSPSGITTPDHTDSASDTSSAVDTGGPEDTGGAGGPEDTGNAKDTGGTGGPRTPGTPRTPGSSEDTGTKGTGGPEDLADTQSADQPVTVVPGVPRYHRSDCILIRFMGDSDLQKMPVEAARKERVHPLPRLPHGRRGDGLTVPVPVNPYARRSQNRRPSRSSVCSANPALPLPSDGWPAW